MSSLKTIETIGTYRIFKMARMRPQKGSHLFVVEDGERFVGATCEQPEAHELIRDDRERRQS